MDNILGQRLTSARKMRGMSLQDLADRLEQGISKQALNKYERGEMMPGSAMLISLSKALDVTVDFFFDQPEVVVELKDLEFRKKISKLGKNAEFSVLEKSKIILERYLELEQQLKLPQKADAFKFEREIRSIEDTEAAAEALRREWNLGYDPIPSVIEMLEDKGYKVIEIEADDAFDGFKSLVQGHKIIVLNKVHSEVRKRFTALHELAHHCLRFAPDLDEKYLEKLCHTFAGAVLYPAPQMRKDMSEERFHFFLQELVMVKERWGISISALFIRAMHLGIISETTCKKLHMNYRQRGYHLGEPGEYAGREKPQRFWQLLYRGIGQDLISINHAAHLAGMNLGEFRNQLDKLV
jgi:Zn-dependent peptidase ImmA (M78 family)/DNA-binding XRE family transcriptional regulator